jgi:putative IMPACT (imprinted ancient) family translation regulator
VLRGSGLGDTVVVITRYFGGTKLGTGGLVRAYSDVARMVLESLPRTEKVEKVVIRVEMGYSFFEPVKRLLTANAGELVSEEFGPAVTLTAQFLPEAVSSFVASVTELTAGRAVVAEI